MRYLIIALILLASCQSNKGAISVKPDTVFVPQPIFIEKECGTDSLLHVIDSMDSRIDTYAKLLLRDRARLQQVDKYVRIVEASPSQIKYLKGWIKRALAE